MIGYEFEITPYKDIYLQNQSVSMPRGNSEIYVMNNNKPRHDQLFRKALENPMVAHELLQLICPVMSLR